MFVLLSSKLYFSQTNAHIVLNTFYNASVDVFIIKKAFISPMISKSCQQVKKKKKEPLEKI